MLTRIWVCRDGRKIALEHMDRSHILNCINKILRSRSGWRKEWLEPLELELEIRDIKRRMK